MFIIKGTFTDRAGGIFWVNTKHHWDSLKRTIVLENATIFKDKQSAELEVADIISNRYINNFKLEIEIIEE